jgi:hypothetical protein
MLGTCAGLTTFLVIEETYGKLARGEPIAKPNASEVDTAAALAEAEERRKRGLDIEARSDSGEKDVPNQDSSKAKTD